MIDRVVVSRDGAFCFSTGADSKLVRTQLGTNKDESSFGVVDAKNWQTDLALWQDSGKTLLISSGQMVGTSVGACV